MVDDGEDLLLLESPILTSLGTTLVLEKTLATEVTVFQIQEEVVEAVDAAVDAAADAVVVDAAAEAVVVAALEDAAVAALAVLEPTVVDTDSLAA